MIPVKRMITLSLMDRKKCQKELICKVMLYLRHHQINLFSRIDFCQMSSMFGAEILCPVLVKWEL